MAIYCKGTEDDKAELIALINRVFQEDFTQIMKKVYGENRHFEGNHHLIKKQGKIVAALGVYEQEFHIRDITLKTGFIGSVAVEEQERKKGYMRLLMEMAEKQMRSDRIALAMLGGLRNRYAHWGYEAGGICHRFHFHEENIRHTIGWQTDASVKIVPVCEEDLEQALDPIYDLYRKKNMWCRERQDFWLSAQTWNHSLYRIAVDGAFLGYLIWSQDGCFIPEIELTDWSQDTLLRIIRAVMRERPSRQGTADDAIHSLVVEAQAWEPQKTAALQKICETYELRPRCMMKILDYPKALTAMLKLRQSYSYPEDGTFVLRVREKGTFVMNIQQGKVSVTADDNDAADHRYAADQRYAADLTVSERDCINALVSPAYEGYESQTRCGSKTRCGSQIRCGSKIRCGYPNRWFPLAFTPENSDEF